MPNLSNQHSAKQIAARNLLKHTLFPKRHISGDPKALDAYSSYQAMCTRLGIPAGPRVIYEGIASKLNPMLLDAPPVRGR